MTMGTVAGDGWKTAAPERPTCDQGKGRAETSGLASGRLEAGTGASWLGAAAARHVGLLRSVDFRIHLRLGRLHDVARGGMPALTNWIVHLILHFSQAAGRPATAFWMRRSARSRPTRTRTVK